MINNVVLVGRLTREVDLRYTQNGVAVANFSLAVDRSYRSSSGERQTDFISCVMWRKSAENFAKFTRKGSLVGVEGSIQTRNYENNQGQRVYVTEVVCDNFSLLEPKSVTESRPQNTGSSYSGGGQSYDGYQPDPDAYSNQGAFNSGYGNAASANPSSQTSYGNSQSAGQSASGNTSQDPFPQSGEGQSSGSDPIDIADDDLPF